MQYLVIVFKSAVPLLESYYAARPEMQNKHPFLVIVVLGGNEILVTRTCADVDWSFL